MYPKVHRKFSFLVEFSISFENVHLALYSWTRLIIQLCKPLMPNQVETRVKLSCCRGPPSPPLSMEALISSAAGSIGSVQGHSTSWGWREPSLVFGQLEGIMNTWSPCPPKRQIWWSIWAPEHPRGSAEAPVETVSNSTLYHHLCFSHSLVSFLHANCLLRVYFPGNLI